MFIIGPKYGFVAALLTSTSTRPKRSTAAFTIASICASSPV